MALHVSFMHFWSSWSQSASVVPQIMPQTRRRAQHGVSGESAWMYSSPHSSVSLEPVPSNSDRHVSAASSFIGRLRKRAA